MIFFKGMIALINKGEFLLEIERLDSIKKNLRENLRVEFLKLGHSVFLLRREIKKIIEIIY